MRETPKPTADEADDGESNQIGYRNVDEEAEHDERGSQGPGGTPEKSDEDPSD